MGIKHLFQIVKEEAGDAIKEGQIKNHFGRKVAIVCLPFPIDFVPCLQLLGCVRIFPTIAYVKL